MSWAVKYSWHPPVGAYSRKSDAQREAARMREANKQAGLKGAVKVVKGAHNPSRKVKRETKAERLMRLQRASRKRGVASAAGTLLKKLNPSSNVHAVRVKRLKGGGVSVIPVKVKR